MSNALGLTVPKYGAPAMWNLASITVSSSIIVPRSGFYFTSQADLDAAVAYSQTSKTPLVFLDIPPMGFSADPRLDDPNAYYPTPALIAQYVNQVQQSLLVLQGAQSVNDANVAALWATATATRNAADARGDARYLASPTLTGDPKAPTAAVGDSDTSIATTGFVLNGPPSAYASGSGFAVANNTSVSATLPTINENNFGMWATGANDRITCQKTGWYRVTGYVQWPSNTAGFRKLYLQVNGSYSASWTDQRLPVSGDVTGQSISLEVGVSAGDIIQLGLYQNSGGSLSTVAHHLSATWIHA